jgi:hypothetical protein
VPERVLAKLDTIEAAWTLLKEEMDQNNRFEQLLESPVTDQKVYLPFDQGIHTYHFIGNFPTKRRD